MINRLFLIACMILCAWDSYAQIDKEFWFAAPYANPYNGRTPVYLRFQAFEEAATVYIDIPANKAFSPRTVQVAANGSYSLDISSWLSQIESIPSNTVLNKGLHITSTKEITVYYELYGTSNEPGTNSDIFPLKGRTALGKLFFTPFQTRFDNQGSIDAYASFDIIATEDNTLITITPAKDIVGHNASIPFTITLNKGQTWSGQAPSTTAGDRPYGSRIEADKPIAVTVKDDSMLDENHWDMGGDQIIPVNQLGTEYFVLKHTMSQVSGNDYAYILATENNTAIFINSNAVALATLNAGEQIEVPITETIHVRTTFPVYIIHLTGFENELAEAIIPQIACTGSKKVGFIRSNSEDFVVNILTKKGNESNFILNGKTNLLTAADFSVITGKPDWVFASKLFTVAQLPALKANLISNPGNFHLSIMGGGSITGFRYGYFSDFGFVDLGPDTATCAGIPLELSAGIQKDSYQWKPTGETSATIFAKDSGTYSVIVKKDTCTFYDTVHVRYFPYQGDIITSKDNDTTCANRPLTIQTSPSYHKFIWSTGEFNKSSITVTQPNTYKVQAKNQYNCTATDFIKITVLPNPTGFIQYSPINQAEFCSTDLIHLSAPAGYSYKWFNGETTQQIQIPKTETGQYGLVITDTLGCKGPLFLEVDCSTFIEVYNLITPNGDNMNDFFKVKGLLNNTYALKIYNSWGSLVYSNDNYNNIWDAEPLEDGVYYFSLIHHKGKRNITGWLHVLH